MKQLYDSLKGRQMTLVDVKEFNQLDGEIVHRGLWSFNMNNKAPKIWSNGWCPTSQIKELSDGRLIGRISNELIPAGIYNGLVVTLKG